ncbi:hypothetical protein D6D69_05115 [Moraxella catarrhalis]|nr:hypothetical protein [Moraxella catarrhalis]MPY08288.1 hypothetical protein [Moraxella catarrhalis]RKL88107.1 hypothetical protein D6D65_02955 [Moraxella catarrhalis]RKL89920.1 hypothetical protein D6D77_02565 [Moraxella catarrhalis]RKM00489.1 hypothetical protein D6D74_00830 [Moraxella catarrhalis]
MSYYRTLSSNFKGQKHNFQTNRYAKKDNPHLKILNIIQNSIQNPNAKVSTQQTVVILVCLYGCIS